MEKITKRQNYATLLAIPAVAENEALVAFINHEVELLSRKRSTTKVDAEREALKTAILDLFDESSCLTTSDVCKGLDGDYSTQKISPLLKALTEEGYLVKTEAKGKAKATYRLA